MALADRYQKPDTRSKFEKWVDSLSDKNRAVVTGWLRDPDISNARIIEWIRDDDPEDNFVGIRVGKDAVSDWRAKHAKANA